MKKPFRFILFIVVAAVLVSCEKKQEEEESLNTLPMEIVQMQPELDEILSMEAEAEILGSGFEWTEGPLWLPETKKLIFSEIPTNRVHVWEENEEIAVYLDPAGYTGEENRGGELGSNGLILDPEGRLVLCQHGDRRMARMVSPISTPEPKYESIVDQYEGMPFNSPNDAVYDTEGNLYFTDPPYGLEYNMDDPKKAIPFQGVYRYSKEGQLDLLLDSISRPNGLAFFPGEKQMLIANSDPEKPHWYLYDLGETGYLDNGRMFYDGSDAFKSDQGLPDGLKINSKGIVFATGPGGIWIFNQEAVLLGRLRVGELTSNVALNEEENILFVTADSYILRIQLK